MFLFLLTCIVTLIKMATQSTRHSCSSKENLHSNYILQRYLNERCQQRAFAPLRGMTDYRPQQQQHSTGTKLSLPQRSSSVCSNLKRPLSSTDSKTVYLTNNSNNNNNDFQASNGKQTNTNFSVDEYELNDEILKNNVQIVLNNLNQNFCNALKELTASNNKVKQQLQLNSGQIAMSSSPESDCNSNPTAATQPFYSNTMLPIGCSIASSQDFTHDNSDYQWFLDYGYRDAMQQPQSVLSSLSASYSGIGELSYYEDLAKNIDANLAEVDMESFRTEDIHSLLTKLPSLQQETKAAQKLTLNDLDNSICKSELLFSPVKESTHISVDSLDMEGFADEQDIILTCKANKDNYTIAFEGSAMYSDDSFYDGPEYGVKLKQNSININNFNNKLLTTPVLTDVELDNSMSKSETGAYTTWSKLRKSNNTIASQKSDEHVTEEYDDATPEPQTTQMIRRHLPHCFVNKSSSMPNLKSILNNQLTLSSNNASNNAISNSSVDSYGNQRALLPHYPMPVSTTSDSESPNVAAMMQQSSEGSHEPANNVPSFNLVKLFIKQKSSSTDTCMDVSSGCWPSDSSGSDNANNNNNNNLSSNRSRKKSMNDSGKGSDRLSRHDEEYDEDDDEQQYDSLDPHPTGKQQAKTLNTAVSSPQKRSTGGGGSHIKDLHLNIRNQLKHPALYNFYKMNNSLNNNSNNLTTCCTITTTQDNNSDTSRTSENLTQIFNINKSRETMTKSIQTSMTVPSSMNVSSTASTKESIRIVPASFLAKIQEEIKKEKASVFVVYPNYALPDLEFVKSTQPQVILSPVGTNKEAFKTTRRPVSAEEASESLKKHAYNHVVDWKSLWTLLPPEYRKLLKNIPEAQEQCMDASVSSQKPIFSMTPPIRQNRGAACDCAYFLNNNTQCSSSGGSSSQPPSSGYRGSSTLLTDSELGAADAATTNLYVYQYETEVQQQQQSDKPPTGRPKGILRRANTGRTPRSKRSSMFEGSTADQQQHEKRRSLQEPFSHPNLIKDYISEMDEHESRFIQQNLLPNYPKQREAYEDYRLHCNNKQEVEARLRAEQFLINVPKSELRHYAEIANILEAEPMVPAYNSLQLRNEVSRALSSQRRVNFTTTTSPSKVRSPVNQRLLKPNELRFTTPPNSPNMSVTADQQRKTSPPTKAGSPGSTKENLEKEKLDKIQKNRFKRLQIQWELLSKENQRLETKSGQTTPTSGGQKSRIPRPVSYPTSKAPEKNLKSPSRIVPPKRYSVPAPTPTPRTPSKTVQAHTTPKKSAVPRVPVPRTR